MFKQRLKTQNRSRAENRTSLEIVEPLPEKAFNKRLQEMIFEPIKNPINILLDYFQEEKLLFLYDGKIDTQAIYFMVLERLQTLIRPGDKIIEALIAEIVNLLKRKNLKNFYPTISKKLNLLKTIVGELKFAPPVGLILHKEGQNLSSVVLRQCQMTNEYFSQIVKKIANQSYKYNYFKDQYCEIETKKTVDEKFNRVAKMKADPNIRSVFPWPSKKELTEFPYRVLFEDIKSKRPRAVYCRTIQQAQLIKDNAISQRISKNSFYIHDTLADLVKIHKIKSITLFYRKFLKIFFGNPANPSRLSFENEAFTRILDEKYGPPKLQDFSEPSLKKSLGLNLNSLVDKPEPIKINLEQSNHKNSGKVEKLEITNSSTNMLKIKSGNDQPRNTETEIYTGYHNFDKLDDQKDEFRIKMKLNLQSEDEPETPSHIMSPYKKRFKLFNFENNSHMQLVEKKGSTAQSKILLAEPQISTQIKSSMLKNNLFQTDTIKQRRNDSKLSPIEESARTIDQSLNWEKYYQNVEKEVQKSTLAPKNETFIATVCENSKTIISVQKLMLYNISRHHKSNIDETDLSNLIFSFKMVLADRREDYSLTLLKEITQHCLIFSIETSLVIQYEGLSEVTFELSEKTSNAILFTETLDLRREFKTIYLETPFVSELSLNLNGYDCSAVLLCKLILIPQSLEVAHLIINKDILQLNFARFGELIRSIDSFARYKALFSPSSNKETINQTRHTNWLSAAAIFQNKNNAILDMQENLFLSSHINKLEFKLERILQRASAYKLGALNFLLEIQEGYYNGYKNGHSIAFDLFGIVRNLLSSEERFYVNDYLFKKAKQNLIKTTEKISDYSFQLSEILKLVEKLDSFVLESGPLLCHEKFLVYQLSIEIYLFMENTTIENSSLNFSIQHVYIIFNILRLNIGKLSLAKLKQIAVNQILSTFSLDRYTRLTQLGYFNTCLIYFKLLLKTIFPKALQILSSFRISYDSLILQLLTSSFAKIMEPVVYSVYQDFKVTLEVALREMQREPDSIIQKLSVIKISFSTLVDICLCLWGIVSETEALLNDVRENLLDNIIHLFIKKSLDIENTLAEILHLLIVLYQNQFYKEDFEYMIQITTSKQGESEKMLETIQRVLQKSNFSDALFKDFVDKEISITKPVLATKKVANAIRHANSGKQEINLKYKGLLLFLNEFVPKKSTKNYQFRSIYRAIKSNFLVEEDQLLEILSRYFRISDSNLKLVANKLSLLLENGKYDLVDVYLCLVCSALTDEVQISEAISHLAMVITSLFYKRTGTVSLTVAYLILEKINSILPFFMFSDYIINELLAGQTKMIYIREAKVNIGQDVIDALEICQAYEADFFHKNKVRGIHFNFEFCEEIITMLENFVENLKIDLNFNVFNLYIEVINKGTVQVFNVPFKLTFTPHLNVKCTRPEPFIFDDNEVENSDLSTQAFKLHLIKHPFFVFFNGNDLYFTMNFLDIKFRLIFMRRETNFIECEFKFCEAADLPTFSSLFPWDFNSKDDPSESALSIKRISIEIPFQYFFLRLNELANLISIYVVELLPEEDLFKFIVNNRSKYKFFGKNGNEIDCNTLLRNMVELDEALKNKSEFVLIKRSDS